MKITAADVAMLRKLCAAATPGPWTPHERAGKSRQYGVTAKKAYDPTVGAFRRIAWLGSPRSYSGGHTIEEDRANATFIAAAREWLPTLLDAVEGKIPLR